MPTSTLRVAVAALFVPLALAASVVPDTALAAPVAKPAIAAAPKPNAAFDAWAERFANDWVRMNPQLASSTQYFSGAEQAALDRQLTPQTPAHRRKMVAMAKTGVARLDKWLAGPLDETQRISASVMRWSLSNVIANEPFEDFNFVFSQFGGPQVGLVNYLTQTHPMRNAADVDSWLARLEQVSLRMDEALARARSATERKLIPPRFILERAQFQVETFLKPAAAQNVLVASLEKRSAELKDLAPEAPRSRAPPASSTTKFVRPTCVCRAS
jgi:uncharacterized protein (DUF885 family)